MRKPVIAIDGYSSTGKSSISKIIAKNLGLVHMDTGALYRGVTYYAINHCLDLEGNIDLPQLLSKLNDITLEFRNVDGELEPFLDGQNISQQIRGKDISAHVSFIACQREIRDFLMGTQRSIAAEGGVILDGRDIGTVVLPNADYKFFLTASVEERTKRRFLELGKMGIEITEEEVKTNLVTRDKIDSERDIAPLKKADDAILIDNSNLSKRETIDLMLTYIKQF